PWWYAAAALPVRDRFPGDFIADPEPELGAQACCFEGRLQHGLPGASRVDAWLHGLHDVTVSLRAQRALHETDRALTHLLFGFARQACPAAPGLDFHPRQLRLDGIDARRRQRDHDDAVFGQPDPVARQRVGVDAVDHAP